MHNRFDEIRKIAKTKDRAALKALMAQDISIDEYKDADYTLTAAGSLAMEGDIKSAEFLRNIGGANVSLIAHGAARGGKINYTEKLRTQHGASIFDIVRGAAVAGLAAYGFGLLKHVAESHKSSFFDEFVFGAAHGKQTMLVNVIMKSKKYAEHTQHSAIIALEGAALAGDRKSLHSLYILTPNERTPWSLLSWAAVGGHRRLIDDILSIHPEHLEKYMPFIAKGAALGNQCHVFEYLFEKHHIKTKLHSDFMEGFALGGHMDAASQWPAKETKPYFKISICAWLGKGGHFALLANKQKDLASMTMRVIMPMLLKSKIAFSESELLHILAFTSAKSISDNFISALITTKKLPALSTSPEQFRKKIDAIRDATHKYDLDYDQARAWVEHGKELSTLLMNGCGMFITSCKDMHLQITRQICRLTTGQSMDMHKKITWSRAQPGFFVSVKVDTASGKIESQQPAAQPK